LKGKGGEEAEIVGACGRGGTLNIRSYDEPAKGFIQETSEYEWLIG